MTGLDRDFINLVKTHDADRFTSTYFAPEDKRDTLLTLYAFNCELDRIPHIVSEPGLGEIRLQWWRDAMDRVSLGESTGHPLADKLGGLIRDEGLPAVRIIEMIDARDFDVSGDQFEELADLKAYVKKKYVAVTQLSVCVFGGGSEKSAMEASVDAGMAYGFMSLLLNIPSYVIQGRIPFPRSFMNDRKVDIETVLRGEDTKQLRQVVEDIMELALKHKESFKKTDKKTLSNFGPAFLPVTLVEASIRKLKSNNHKLLRDLVQINPLYRLWKYWKAMALLRF